MVSRLQSRWELLKRRGDEAGQGLVEYALVVALIAMAALVAISTLGGGIAGVLTRIGTKLAGVG
jgi:pilus assembly protein Flp/PilA